METPQGSPPAAPPPTPHQVWSRSAVWMLLVIVLAVNGVIFLKSCRSLPGETLDKTGQVIDKAGRALSNIAAAFKQGTVTTAFLSYATTISNHQRLQVSTLRQTEVFTQTNQSSTAWGYVPLPDVVVGARAPVEYTYYLDFNAPWLFTLTNGLVIVAAPPVQFNKPAVDASAITYEVSKGHFKTAEALDALKRSITSLVIIRAKENIPLVRENARKQATEFVENWLMRSFPDAKNYSVKVLFPGERLPGSFPPILPTAPQRTNAPQ